MVISRHRKLGPGHVSAVVAVVGGDGGLGARRGAHDGGLASPVPYRQAFEDIVVYLRPVGSGLAIVPILPFATRQRMKDIPLSRLDGGVHMYGVGAIRVVATIQATGAVRLKHREVENFLLEPYLGVRQCCLLESCSQIMARKGINNDG